MGNLICLLLLSYPDEQFVYLRRNASNIPDLNQHNNGFNSTPFHQHIFLKINMFSTVTSVVFHAGYYKAVT